MGNLWRQLRCFLRRFAVFYANERSALETVDEDDQMALGAEVEAAYYGLPLGWIGRAEIHLNFWGAEAIVTAG